MFDSSVYPYVAVVECVLGSADGTVGYCSVDSTVAGWGLVASVSEVWSYV